MRILRFIGMCAVALFFSSCGHKFIKTEEFLQCEQAFKHYLQEQAALASIAVAFGGSASGVLNADAVELIDYEVVGSTTVQDSIDIFRAKAIGKYEDWLNLQTESMNCYKRYFDDEVKIYHENRERTRRRLEEIRNGAKLGVWETVEQHEEILAKPAKTIEELQRDALKGRNSSYSCYVQKKETVDDLINRKQEIIDNWFPQTKYYLSLAPDKVLAKSVKVTYCVDGNKEDKREAVLMFNPDLTKVLEK